MQFRFRLFVCFLLVVLSSPSFHVPMSRGRVVGVNDGDTIEVLVSGLSQKVRLEHIDAPEKKQAWGTRAKQACADLCYGQTVLLKGRKKDRFGRLISEVETTNGTNVNLQLVRNGHAWHFTKYSSAQQYARAEQQARSEQRGLWSLPSPVPPWEFRKRR